VSSLHLSVVRVFPARQRNMLPWLPCVDAVINISVLFLLRKTADEDRVLWLVTNNCPVNRFLCQWVCLKWRKWLSLPPVILISAIV
jgi:hypothetical protein